MNRQQRRADQRQAATSLISCPAKGCRRRFNSGHLACNEHEQLVSPATRQRIQRARGGSLDEHIAAMTVAIGEIDAALAAAAGGRR